MLKGFIPHSDEDLLEWTERFVAYLASRRAAFCIEDETFFSLQKKFDAYRAAYTAAAFPKRNNRDLQEKTKAREDLVAAITFLVTVYIAFNPTVTNADRERMRLPRPDTTREPLPPPPTFPEIDISGSGERRLTIRFKDSGSGKRARPKGAQSIEMRWAFLNRFPSSVDELTNAASCTTSPHTMSFKEEDRARVCYMCACWQNSRGEKGPWGMIAKALIP